MPITELLEKNAKLYGDEIALVEINPEKKSKLTPIKNILITAAVASGLILILIISLLIFRHMLIKRRGDTYRGRSKML